MSFVVRNDKAKSFFSPGNSFFSKCMFSSNYYAGKAQTYGQFLRTELSFYKVTKIFDDHCIFDRFSQIKVVAWLICIYKRFKAGSHSEL